MALDSLSRVVVAVETMRNHSVHYSRHRPSMLGATVGRTLLSALGAPGRFRYSSSTLSKSVGLGSPRFRRVRDLGCLFCAVRAGRLRT